MGLYQVPLSRTEVGYCSAGSINVVERGVSSRHWYTFNCGLRTGPLMHRSEIGFHARRMLYGPWRSYQGVGNSGAAATLSEQPDKGRALHD